MLLTQSEARVHLDARKAEVVLPKHLSHSSHLCLDYSYGFTPPIPDLALDERGIVATLSFSRVAQTTFVPWSAVFCIVDFSGRGMVWEEDVPAELKGALTAVAIPEPAATPTPPPPPAKKERPSHLKLVK